MKAYDKLASTYEFPKIRDTFGVASMLKAAVVTVGDRVLSLGCGIGALLV